jgi:hypothetical protein
MGILIMLSVGGLSACGALVVMVRRQRGIALDALLPPGDPAFWERDLASEIEGFESLTAPT